MPDIHRESATVWAFDSVKRPNCCAFSVNIWHVSHLSNNFYIEAAIPLIKYASVLMSPTRNVSLTLPGRPCPCRFTHTVVYPNFLAGTISYLNPNPACQISDFGNPSRSRARRKPLWLGL